MSTTASDTHLIFGHPRGLLVLFFAEMAERFSFYGMKALLIFYLLQHFRFDDAEGYMLVAIYTALNYTTPLLGGYLGDRYLGLRKAVVIGGIFLVVGHGLMAWEGQAAFLTEEGVQRDEAAVMIFYLALSCIVTGVGFLKSNLSGLVGALYPEGSEKREAGYTLYYLGINIGALAGNALCGYLGMSPQWGWAWGFGAAGVVMAVSLLIFLVGQSWLDGKAEPPNPERLSAPVAGPLNREHLIWLGGVLLIVAVWLMFQVPDTVNWLLLIGGTAAIVYVVKRTHEIGGMVAVKQLSGLLALMFGAIVFWTLFDQQALTISVFVERHVELHLFGVGFTPAQNTTLNPFFIIVLAGPMSMLWDVLAARGRNPSIPLKFVIGLVLAAASFAALAYAPLSESGRVVALWLVLHYFLITLGELCLSPVGLAAVSRYTLPSLVSLMMGVWFLTVAIANVVAGQVAALASVETLKGEAPDPVLSYQAFTGFFEGMAIGSLICAGALLLVWPLIRRGLDAKEKAAPAAETAFSATD